MKLTLKEFNDRVMPLLRERHKTAKELEAAIKSYLGEGGSIVDDEDRPVDLQILAEPEGIQVSQASLEAAVTKAIEKVTKDRPAFNGGGASSKSYAVPATAKRWGGSRLKAFLPNDPDREYKAYAMGLLTIHTITEGKNEHAKSWLEKEGFLQQIARRKAMGEGSNITGGTLVPDEFSADLIRLVEEYGVFRANAEIDTMTRDTKTSPRRTGGLTAYAMTEHGTITTSDMSTDAVMLVAKKWATLTRISSELNEDSAISIGDLVSTEIAQAFANKEDDCGFNGDGTSTYHGIFGARPKIDDGNHTAGVHTATTGDTAFTDWILADMHALIGLLPKFAQRNAKFYCHHAVFANTMQRLGAAQGGVTWAETAAGPQMRFLGYPVVISQIMPATSGTSKIMVLLGDLAMAAKFGDRKSMEIATSEHRYFDQDQIAIRGIERMDINVHDLGDTTNAGPIVAYKTAAS